MIKIDGNKFKKELLEEYKEKIASEHLDIRLDIIFVGDNGASEVYVGKKLEAASYVGIRTNLHRLGMKTTTKEVQDLIKSLNEDDEVTGIILQSPVPKGVDFDSCAGLIESRKDIDGFTKQNIFALYNNDEELIPCTVKGIIKLLTHYGVNLEGKNVVIIGRSSIVGKPLALALINRNATVTVCHSKTVDLEAFTKNADILISAVGVPGLIKENMVKEGFVGIDVGTTRVFDEASGKNKLKGDFDFEALSKKASLITPVPGGVGPMTVTCVIENLIDAKLEEKKHQKKMNLKINR